MVTDKSLWDQEKEQYERRIAHLESENFRLKERLDGVEKQCAELMKQGDDRDGQLAEVLENIHVDNGNLANIHKTLNIMVKHASSLTQGTTFQEFPEAESFEFKKHRKERPVKSVMVDENSDSGSSGRGGGTSGKTLKRKRYNSFASSRPNDNEGSEIGDDSLSLEIMANANNVPQLKTLLLSMGETDFDRLSVSAVAALIPAVLQMIQEAQDTEAMEQGMVFLYELVHRQSQAFAEPNAAAYISALITCLTEGRQHTRRLLQEQKVMTKDEVSRLRGFLIDCKSNNEASIHDNTSGSSLFI